MAPGPSGADGTTRRSRNRRDAAMPLKLSDDLKALVRGANFAHLATLMPDGSPQVAPVWVDLDGDFILVSTGEGSLKAKNPRRDARVGLSIIGQSVSRGADPRTD